MAQIHKKTAKSRPCLGLFRLIHSGQGCDLAHFVGDLSQSETLSEINPPLSRKLSIDMRLQLQMGNVYLH